MSVSPRRPIGPPLNAMRAFEAAARHESFVAAAEELSVTPGAISQHVKALEAWAEMPLFSRSAHRVELTEAGQALVVEFTLAFDHLSNAARALKNLNAKTDFHIATLPSIAQLWLPKRLAAIRARFPQLSFSVTALESPPSLSRELFDLAIFFGVSDGSANQSCLRKDEIIPVCAPALMDRFDAGGFDDLALLHDQTWAGDWRFWAETAGVAIKDPQAGPKFSLYSLAVEEAKAGAGALIGHVCLVEDLIANGTLIELADVPISTRKELLLYLPNRSQQRPETNQVAEMLA